MLIDTDVARADLEARALWHAELEDRARWMAGADLGEPEDADDSDAYFEDEEDPWNAPGGPCMHCSGTGGDPWNDGITPCEACDGEGYEWWK